MCKRPKLPSFFVFIALSLAVAAVGQDVVLENNGFRYTIATDAKNLGFVDKATGRDYLRRDAPSICAAIRRGGKEYPATSAKLAGSRLVLGFAGADTEATLKVEAQASSLRLTVESVKGAGIDSLVFLNVPLKLKGSPEEPFGACALSLNLITRVDQLPALQSELRAAAYQKFGIVGAKVAVVGVPQGRMLSALKEELNAASELPLCKVAGPWAQEIPFNHGSYLFNFGSLTETNVDDWIEMVRSLGFTQIDNHGGGAGFFRFGDFELNRNKWPGGWEDFRRINERLHTKGIGAIFHSYAFFIDKQSKYVNPIPDGRLDAFRSFTLAEDVAADADTMTVNESTAGMTTVTGFFENNSVVLHLGDELVTFGGVSQTAPWRFTGVKRGAFGTRTAAHGKGSTARHLKECFGLFVPNPETSLFEEIAANHADIVNRCSFDGIYLDAIDGASILRGGDGCWYWADKFVVEIQKRLKKPVGMEMSAMWHHFWQYRTRWQAWDYPQRGHQRFIDLHAQTVNGGLLLPLHLGWWSFTSFNPPQVEPTYVDVMECLGARLVGWDAGISLTAGVDREQLKKVPLFRRAVETLHAVEELRHSVTLDVSAKAKLREPDSEFSLVTDVNGKARFRRSRSQAHTISLAEPWSASWSVTNTFAEQSIKVRIEALMSTASGISASNVVLGNLAEGVWKASAAQGVQASLSEPQQGGDFSGVFVTATNTGKVDRRAAWACYRKQFTPPLNLRNQQALGLWIEGDGQGEIVAVRLESPQHIAFGAVADRYVDIDFTGKRYVSLVETESARWSDYTWNDGKSPYNVYRETIDFGAIDSVSIWCQNLPPGKGVKVGIGPVKALPMLPAAMKNPMLVVNGVSWTFPVELSSGSWIECNGPGDCTVYGAKGEILEKILPSIQPPKLPAGRSELRFSCESGDGPPPRAKVTVFNYGEEI